MAGWHEVVNQWAQEYLGAGAVLCLMTCGQHFGGSPCAVRFALTSYDIADDYFEFRFDGAPVLTVVNPYQVAREGGELIIVNCEYMRFEWHRPGMTPSPETLCGITYMADTGIMSIEEPPDFNEYETGGAEVLVLAAV